MRRRSQGLVEFALVAPIMFLVILGIMEIARAAWQENTLAFAAREGTRYAIVHGASSTSPSGPGSATFNGVDQDTGVNNAVLKYTNGVVSNVTIKSAWPDGDNQRNHRVTVDVTAPFIPAPAYFLWGNAFNITLRGGSQLVIQH